ncbi:MAG TPA: hypothetical protein VJN88_11820, partial [Ktedonobacterales bacterium]|nr:hypothetical protein [Ktedonobacterales bacterium]
MRRRTINFLLFILLLGVGAFFVDFGFGTKPSIDIGGYKNSLDVRQGLDLQGGIQLILTPKCPSDTPHCDISSAMSAVIANVQQRIAGGLAVNDATVREQSSGGTPLILVQLPGLKDDQQALSLLGTTGQMNIIDTGSTQIPVGQAVTICPTSVTTCPSGSYHVVFRGQQLNTGSIAAGLDSQTNQPIVTFAF